jgi:hypothetical protein
MFIRDAIAHGRLVTTNELPFRLWKFGPRKNGQVDIEFSEELTADWLKSTSAKVEARNKRYSVASKPAATKGWASGPPQSD